MQGYIMTRDLGHGVVPGIKEDKEYVFHSAMSRVYGFITLVVDLKSSEA